MTFVGLFDVFSFAAIHASATNSTITIATFTIVRSTHWVTGIMLDSPMFFRVGV